MVSFFWFRRDLRLSDNKGLTDILKSGYPVIPLFIFDTNIIRELPPDDPRISFIYRQLEKIDKELRSYGSSLLVKSGDPEEVLVELTKSYRVKGVTFNKDYEPYAIKRDDAVKSILTKKGIEVSQFKDQVIFEENEVTKSDGSPYTVFTPYKRRWLQRLLSDNVGAVEDYNPHNFHKHDLVFPSLNEIGFSESAIKVRDFDLSQIESYSILRDIPGADSTTYLSPHLRFGTISIRELIRVVHPHYPVLTSELIWREFFMQILFHFPKVVTSNFRQKYDGIEWRNNKLEFDRWCNGMTGYPIVDAGMRQLKQTGYMHNRVRMITAGFLCKHLLIDWRWGEAWFAEKLIDYELSSNNGNWQWAAGTGCDAAPYFRVFNPSEQQRKFDKDETYIKRWIPEYGTEDYPEELVEHKTARERALKEYKKGILYKATHTR